MKAYRSKLARMPFSFIYTELLISPDDKEQSNSKGKYIRHRHRVCTPSSPKNSGRITAKPTPNTISLIMERAVYSTAFYRRDLTYPECSVHHHVTYVVHKYHLAKK